MSVIAIVQDLGRKQKSTRGNNGKSILWILSAIYATSEKSKAGSQIESSVGN
jgi:hypothetical protein